MAIQWLVWLNFSSQDLIWMFLYMSKIDLTNLLYITLTHGHTSVDQSVKMYIHQLCVDTKYSLEEWWPIGIDSKRELKEFPLSVCLEDDIVVYITFFILDPRCLQQKKWTIIKQSTYGKKGLIPPGSLTKWLWSFHWSLH